MPLASTEFISVLEVQRTRTIEHQPPASHPDRTDKSPKPRTQPTSAFTPDSDGLGHPLLEHLLHLLPRHVDVKLLRVLGLGRERRLGGEAHGDVDEIQVQVLQLKVAQGLLQGRLHLTRALQEKEHARLRTAARERGAIGLNEIQVQIVSLKITQGSSSRQAPLGQGPGKRGECS